MRMKLLFVLGALLAAPAFAQSTQPPVGYKGWVDQVAVAMGSSGQTSTPVSIDNPLPILERGNVTMATGQVSVGTSATLVAAARSARRSLTVNVLAANACTFGNTGVTTTTGYQLAPTVGATVTLPTTAAVYAVCAATTTVSFVEHY